MIQLKMNSKNNNELFASQITPYVEKIIEVLGKTQLRQDLVIPLEKAIRNKTKSDVEKLFQEDCFNTYKNIYMTNARHIIENLKTNNQINNIELIEKVNNNTITIEQLVELTPEDMYNERWKPLIEKKLLDINKLTSDPEATSDLFWCSRCHRNKTTYFERQDRSADEPMTIHITCCYCGRRWKQ